MPDNENEETKVTENQVSAADEPLVLSPDDRKELKDLTAQLDEEKTARTAVEVAMAGKDTRIAELEGQLNEFTTQLEGKTKELEASVAELAAAKEAKTQAVAKYLEMAKALNPTIPEGIIVGETIEEIDQSIEKGKTIVEAVKKAMEAEAAGTKVPAGAPTRGEISLEGLSPRDKIAAGIQQKGGT